MNWARLRNIALKSTEIEEDLFAREIRAVILARHA